MKCAADHRPAVHLFYCCRERVRSFVDAPAAARPEAASASRCNLRLGLLRPIVAAASASAPGFVFFEIGININSDIDIYALSTSTTRGWRCCVFLSSSHPAWSFSTQPRG